MLTNETLRFIDDNTFQEADPPEDRSRPLEWRRSFNTISFEADNPKIEYVYSVNEVDHFAGIAQTVDEPPRPIVAPAATRRIRVTFEVQQDKLRDSILCTKEKEKGSGLFHLRGTKDAIQIVLTATEPTEPRDPYAQGAYPGLAFQTNFEPGEDGLCLEVGLPSQQLEEIAAELKSGQSNAIHVAISLQSFSYEVDDALREWYHPRDLFIHGGATQAVIVSVRLLRREAEPEIQREAGPEEPAAPVVHEVPATAAPDYSSLLKGIKTALWAIAGLLLLRLFK
jgi:hypothetical protein